jgi:hypothetical protein
MADVVTEFNSSAATLERVDRSLRLAADASVNNDFNRWYKYLDSAMKEVWPKMKKEQREEIMGKRKQIANVLNVLNGRARKSQVFLNKVSSDLLDYELMLRGRMDRLGMLMKNKDIAGSALSRG